MAEAYFDDLDDRSLPVIRVGDYVVATFRDDELGTPAHTTIGVVGDFQGTLFVGHDVVFMVQEGYHDPSLTDLTVLFAAPTVYGQPYQFVPAGRDLR